MASVPKIHQGFGQIFGWDNKKGHLDKWRFYENDKCGKNLFKVWQKLKQDDKRGMWVMVAFTKMTYFAKRTGEFGKDWDNETTKQSYWQLAIFTKMANVGKWARIHPRSGKTSNEVTKRGILTKGKFRQIWQVCQKNHQGFGQIFKWDDKKGHVDSCRSLGQWQILRRWRIWQEVIKGLTKIYKKMTKRGILTNGDYNKHGKLGNNSFKVSRGN